MYYAIIWGVLFFLLLGVEMITGTFYLLMISIGMLAGAGAALLGLDVIWQIGLAGSISAVITALFHFKRVKNPKAAIYSENKDALIDIGQLVEVNHWGPDKTTQVRHRGAEWSARWVGEGVPTVGSCVIRGIKGSQLQLNKVSP
ncbi:MAG: NfeD family protein [Saezia sp.]